jgi:hypothetical protein
VPGAIEHLKSADLAGSPWPEACAGAALNPEDWPTLPAEVQRLDQGFEAWPVEAVQAIEVPALTAEI